jgi:hypothetical protein
MLKDPKALGVRKQIVQSAKRKMVNNIPCIRNSNLNFSPKHANIIRPKLKLAYQNIERKADTSL